MPAAKSKSKKSDVKMAADGRIIIANDDDNDAASELSDKMDQISLSKGKTDNEDGQFSYKGKRIVGTTWDLQFGAHRLGFLF